MRVKSADLLGALDQIGAEPARFISPVAIRNEWHGEIGNADPIVGLAELVFQELPELGVLVERGRQRYASNPLELTIVRLADGNSTTKSGAKQITGREPISANDIDMGGPAVAEILDDWVLE